MFAAALFAFVVALFTLTTQFGFFVRGGDGVEAGADDRASGFRRPTDDRSGPADDGADKAALQHQTTAQRNDDLGYGNEAISTHGRHSRDLE
ncbi:hypothetical protein [Brevundimonas vesicularis]|uniref:hypothetical protein n=1 Tax=Brevundimonas vesicularis TaxID=41276 RepID=UPI00161741AF|nr:hypothetical protein [Brevundimonas vesicularis]